MADHLDDAIAMDSTDTLFYGLPPIVDDHSTRSLELQQQTVRECLPLLIGTKGSLHGTVDFDEFGRPQLTRDLHVDFAHDTLGGFPAAFVGIDASRPWFIYWALTSLYLLGEDQTAYRSRVIESFHSMQNTTGGYGGGHGHTSHLAATYAALLSLATIGGDEAYLSINRSLMWQWLGKLKLANGGFVVCENGEEDVRGAYCALVAISLLNLPWELPKDSPARQAGLSTFGDGLGEYLSRCQTYEGGIAAAPGFEAHGAYTFCALACLCLLDDPKHTLNSYLDMDSLLRWLSSRQYAPEGGFAGRTNKLVDGCYSHWIGGCWPLVQAAMRWPRSARSTEADDGHRYDIYSADGLARYILCCCQSPTGGLRDKPSMRPDIYHTCYNLVGLSVTEHVSTYTTPDPEDRFSTLSTWTSKSKKTEDTAKLLKTDPLEADLKSLHPVLVVPQYAVVSMREWAMSQIPVTLS